ncbi:peptidyl-prolyl cis-trans isomerase [Fervidibacillus halotolerans]|uniref:Peptidyl-prolyl cis-trans isomerase n=1 Tax=Fervidibacillus halotolerans TaxID=2980027 RepID=A0A9E8M144_9BACI|nr:peptidyl-prolyl cis-trans isomerase [Fervidibacillus halotolerans]WAA13251.1 peptidyl-prolyl cis-trans isomerase [Fervidibacillus halotolerans]
MENILEIKGNVSFKITLDPGVWIFDDRRIDLDTYFQTNTDHTSKEELYEEKISKYWSREISEGAVSPPTLNTEKKYEKEKVLTGSFGMPIEPFINNAEPGEDAKTLVIETKQGNTSIPLDQGKKIILGFSKNGKPLKEDGPVHVYYGDGSNKENPITNVTGFTII